MEKISGIMFIYVLLATCFVNTLAIDYLDTETLIVRRSPGDKGALFGYSAVLHSVDVNGGIDNMRYRMAYMLYYIPIVRVWHVCISSLPIKGGIQNHIL